MRNIFWLVFNPHRIGARIYNPPMTKLSIRFFYPNLGVLFNYLGPLVPLVPLGLIGAHLLVTRVWGTPIEANLH